MKTRRPELLTGISGDESRLDGSFSASEAGRESPKQNMKQARPKAGTGCAAQVQNFRCWTRDEGQLATSAASASAAVFDGASEYR